QDVRHRGGHALGGGRREEQRPRRHRRATAGIRGPGDHVDHDPAPVGDGHLQADLALGHQSVDRRLDAPLRVAGGHRSAPPCTRLTRDMATTVSMDRQTRRVAACRPAERIARASLPPLRSGPSTLVGDRRPSDDEPGGGSTMNLVTDAAAGVLRGPLRSLERRAAAAHGPAAWARDPAFGQRHLPTVETVRRYFAPEVRHVERLPATGPVLVVGNHSGVFYMPDMWATAAAVVRRRGVDTPVFGLGYDPLFTLPGVESVLRRFGALPASGHAAERALADGAALLVYPGGDWEACRPWTQRNRVDLHGTPASSAWRCAPGSGCSRWRRTAA